MTTIRATSHQIISHRLAHRSTRAPAGRATSANAAVDAEVSRPTPNVDALEHHDGGQRQGEEGDRRADLADALPGPQQEEVPVPPQRPGRGRFRYRFRRTVHRLTVRARWCEDGLRRDAVPAMKLTPTAAMRARDVSRPRAEHVAEAEAAEASIAADAGQDRRGRTGARRDRPPASRRRGRSWPATAQVPGRRSGVAVPPLISRRSGPGCGSASARRSRRCRRAAGRRPRAWPPPRRAGSATRPARTPTSR